MSGRAPLSDMYANAFDLCNFYENVSLGGETVRYRYFQ